MPLAIVIFFLTLLILVLVHEFGHFVVAKFFNVKVLEFGFGLPPRAWGKKVGETLVSINWLPMGGFVRLFGEDETDPRLLKDKRSFPGKPVGQRILIALAGVTMNLLFSWILFYAVLISQNFQIFLPAGEPSANVVEVEQGSPAEQAGIKPGEKIVKIDNRNINSVTDVRSAIKDKAGKPVLVTIENKNGSRQTLTVTPKEYAPGEVRLGAAFSPFAILTYKTIPEKIISAPSYSWEITKVTLSGFTSIFKDLGQGNFGTASQSVSGPIGIAVATNNIVSAGAVFFYLWFVGVLSLSLAIINILPFPALDGGRLAFFLIEAATGKRVNPEVERMVHTIGLFILIGLFLLITYSDLLKLFR